MSVINITFVDEMAQSRENYWLIALILKVKQDSHFLKKLKDASVMPYTDWQLINEFTIYDHCQSIYFGNAKRLEKSVVNISSSARDR